jgi:hypothetical protein
MNPNVRYNPEIHKGLPIYTTITQKLDNGLLASVVTQVTKKEDLDNAEKCPHWYFVKRSDVEARDRE